MNTKKCSSCLEEKQTSEFNLDRGYLRSKCKSCSCSKQREFYHNNKEKNKQKRKEYHLKTYPLRKEKQQAKVRQKTKTPEYREKNNKRLKEKRDSDPVYRMKINMRRRCLTALKGGYKHETTFKLVGCSSEDLKIHLESQFKQGMTWENYGSKGWVVDHVIPLALFDLSNEEEQKKAFHYTNLQPLWWHENLAKGAKL